MADASHALGAAVSAASKAIAVAIPAGAPEYFEVVDWLNREARLLDQGEFDSWLALMAPEIIYTMPTRICRSTPKTAKGSTMISACLRRTMPR